MNDKKYTTTNYPIEPIINEDGYYPQCPICQYFDLEINNDCPICKQQIDWSWIKSKGDN